MDSTADNIGSSFTDWYQTRYLQDVDPYVLTTPHPTDAPAIPPQSERPTSPTDTPPATEEEADGPGFSDYAGDVAKGAYNGGISFIQETGQFAWDVGNFVGLTDEEKMPGYDSLKSFKAETTTMAGKLTEDVVALGLGFLGAGKFLTPAKLLQKAGKGGMAARAAYQGAIADFVVMDPVEQRLSDFVQQYPTFANPITEALSSKEGDSRWEGRLKNAAEGVLVGAAFETLLWSIRAARGIKHNNPRTTQEATKELQALSTREGKEAAATQALHKEFREAAMGVRDLDPGQVYKQAAENTKSTEELLERLPHVLNQHQMSFMDDKALKLNEAVCEQVYDRTLRAEGVESINSLTLKAVDDLRAIDGSLDAEKLVAALERTSASSAEGRALRLDIQKVRAAHNHMTLRLSELGETLSTMGAKDGDEALKMMAEMDSICRMLGQTTVAIRDAGTTAGRNLRAFRQVADGSSLLLKDAPNVEQAIRKAISEGRIQDPREWTKKLKDVDFRQTANDPRYAQQVANALQSKGWKEMLKEAYISSILFGVRTNLTNTISNAAQLTFTPAFRAIGNLPSKGLEAFKQEAIVYQSMVRNISTALDFAKRAWRERRGILDSTQGAAYTEGRGFKSTWTAENIKGRAVLKNMQKGMSPEEAMNVGAGTEFMAKVVGGVGKFIQLPGRFLEVQDEFFKQLAYRSEVEAAAMEEALTKFGRVKSKEAAEFVQQKVAAAFDARGAVTDSSALNYARRMTFTQPLKQGSVPEFLQRYGNGEGYSNTIVKLAMPFVRTPTNILTASIEYVPFLNRLSSHYREAMAVGGRQAAEMQGKAAMGGLIIAGALFAAAEGRITGSSPRDQQLREAGQRIGWQPNSFKAGDTYVSFQRTDPVATLLTVCADLVAASPHLSRKQYGEFATALGTSVIHMLEDKSYLQGIKNVMGLVSGETKGDWQRFGTQLATGFVPNFIREASRGSDEFQRDLRALSSKVASAIPGFSQDLPAKYDWLTGQPVAGGVAHLFGFSSINDDPVGYELATLGGVMKSPGYKFGNGSTELTEEQHSRLNQLIGTIKLDGLTLHESLEKVIHSKEYDLDRKKRPEVDGFRSAWLKKICASYKKAAVYQLGQEYPALAQSAREERQEKRDNLENKRTIQAEGLRIPKPPTRRQSDTAKLQKIANL